MLFQRSVNCENDAVCWLLQCMISPKTDSSLENDTIPLDYHGVLFNSEFSYTLFVILMLWCRYDAKLTTPVHGVTKPASKSVFHVQHTGTPQQENSPSPLSTKQFGVPLEV